MDTPDMERPPGDGTDAPDPGRVRALEEDVLARAREVSREIVSRVARALRPKPDRGDEDDGEGGA